VLFRSSKYFDECSPLEKNSKGNFSDLLLDQNDEKRMLYAKLATKYLSYMPTYHEIDINEFNNTYKILPPAYKEQLINFKVSLRFWSNIHLKRNEKFDIIAGISSKEKTQLVHFYSSLWNYETNHNADFSNYYKLKDMSWNDEEFSDMRLCKTNEIHFVKAFMYFIDAQYDKACKGFNAFKANETHDNKIFLADFYGASAKLKNYCMTRNNLKTFAPNNSELHFLINNFTLMMNNRKATWFDKKAICTLSLIKVYSFKEWPANKCESILELIKTFKNMEKDKLLTKEFEDDDFIKELHLSVFNKKKNIPKLIEGEAESYHIFFSYSWTYKTQCEQIFRWLSEFRFNVWFDNTLDGKNPKMGVGDDAKKKMKDSIAKSKIFLCFLSPEYIQSYNCLFELNEAHLMSLPILPVMISKINWDTDFLQNKESQKHLKEINKEAVLSNLKKSFFIFFSEREKKFLIDQMKESEKEQSLFIGNKYECKIVLSTALEKSIEKYVENSTSKNEGKSLLFYSLDKQDFKEHDNISLSEKFILFKKYQLEADERILLYACDKNASSQQDVIRDKLKKNTFEFIQMKSRRENEIQTTKAQSDQTRTHIVVYSTKDKKYLVKEIYNVTNNKSKNFEYVFGNEKTRNIFKNTKEECIKLIDKINENIGKFALTLKKDSSEPKGNYKIDKKTYFVSYSNQNNLFTKVETRPNNVNDIFYEGTSSACDQFLQKIDEICKEQEKKIREHVEEDSDEFFVAYSKIDNKFTVEHVNDLTNDKPEIGKKYTMHNKGEVEVIFMGLKKKCDDLVDDLEKRPEYIRESLNGLIRDDITQLKFENYHYEDLLRDFADVIRKLNELVFGTEQNLLQ